MANRRRASALDQVPWGPKGKVNKFGKKMREWWMALQPDSRGGNWPLLRVVDEGESWSQVKKGGSAGIVLMVIGLNWWVRHAELVKDKNEAASVVEDVVFVLGKVLESMDDADSEEGSRKKKK